MNALQKFLRCFVLVASLGAIISAQAQTLPGVPVEDSAPSQSALTLIKLAQQAYPDLFAQGSSWYSYEGFHYKFFASSGIYVGIQGNDLYLLGGQFGSQVSYQGSLANAISVLQQGLGSSAQPFQDYVIASTLLDLISYFKKLTMNYGSNTAIGSAAPTVLESSITMEVVGAETYDGAAATRLKITLTGNNLTAPVSYDMWVNAEGKVSGLRQGTFEYAPAQAALIGPGLVSSMLLALKGADSALVRAVVADELKDNAAVSQKVRNSTIGGLSVQTLDITVSDNASTKITVALSDFGPFTMVSKMYSSLKSLVSTSVTTFEMTDVQFH